MRITIYLDADDLNENVLLSAVSRVRNRFPVGGTHGIHIQPRDGKGCQDAMLIMNSDQDGSFVPGKSMTVCQHQRSLSEPLEYHS